MIKVRICKTSDLHFEEFMDVKDKVELGMLIVEYEEKYGELVFQKEYLTKAESEYVIEIYDTYRE